MAVTTNKTSGRRMAIKSITLYKADLGSMVSVFKQLLPRHYFFSRCRNNSSLLHVSVECAGQTKFPLTFVGPFVSEKNKVYPHTLFFYVVPGTTYEVYRSTIVYLVPVICQKISPERVYRVAFLCFCSPFVFLV